jgi:hypothetical protein
MKPSVTLSLVSTLAAAVLVAAQDAPPPGGPTPEHRWLMQGVGEWDTVTRMTSGAEMLTVDRVRAVGEFWTVNEVATTDESTPFSAVLMLGYDPEQGRFIGTWIDSSSSMLWHYTGSLDEAGKALTVETEGPLPWDPLRRGRYREVTEFKSPDHRTSTSTVQNEDGTWVSWVTMESRRKDT